MPPRGRGGARQGKRGRLVRLVVDEDEMDVDSDIDSVSSEEDGPAEKRAHVDAAGTGPVSFRDEAFRSSGLVLKGRFWTWKNLKQVLAAERLAEAPPSVPTYISIEAPPSLRPRKKYCDVTGLPAPYTDPNSGVRFRYAALHSVIKQTNPAVLDQMLRVRGAHAKIR